MSDIEFRLEAWNREDHRKLQVVYRAFREAVDLEILSANHRKARWQRLRELLEDLDHEREADDWAFHDSGPYSVLAGLVGIAAEAEDDLRDIYADIGAGLDGAFGVTYEPKKGAIDGEG
jgi:hypothetical protein